MKFGKVDHPEIIDFTLPKDHPDTAAVLNGAKGTDRLNISVGCAKWNRQDLKNFYPRGTKDELAYYSSQFNSIELNATFYRIFPAEQYQKWYDKTPEDFRFFPKISRDISHLRRLNDAAFPIVDRYLEVTANLKEKLGTIFLQMHDNFGPKNWDRVVRFVEYWPKEFPLAIEFRHTDWFNDEKVSQELYHLLEENNMANILVDTAGRRDMLHMRLTNNEAFVRYVGANHPTDYERLNDWIARLDQWKSQGLQNIHFFVHQNMEVESPLLSASFIDKLNKKWGTDLHIPKSLEDSYGKLF
ncbi:DUF72 domain-containing protein [Zobellia galactanivorans]|uniref:DUF72 domain-containing protein n=1 Tax=Zobellia galactanivorans (strain DSM 12802 / CCUG 47099 / CIP 106680 / NCIMB 13871 / Dsij) TaxID=63186 RepID=UPI0026E3D80E|nr:DUF72 domain-containing protein [Zobellia galactanivorans]MDO6808676.1 DUF72 domain-containing protein [Zobellia galactanivorans]